jgi:uncharacterized membrane protein
MSQLKTARKVSIRTNAIFYAGAGCMHFIQPAFYVRIVPPYLPWHSQLVAISGVLEILGGSEKEMERGGLKSARAQMQPTE